MIDGVWLVASAAMIGIHWLVPGPVRPAFLAATGIVGLSVLSPVAGVALGLCTLIAIAGSRRSRSLLGLVVVIGAFFAYRAFWGDLGLESNGDVVALVGFAYTVPRVVQLLIAVRLEQLDRPPTAQIVQYLWFAPLLVIGPIHRFDEHEREQRRARWDPALAARGVERIVVGLFVVVVVANQLIDRVFGDFIDGFRGTRPGVVAAGQSIEYGFRLYATFAGWSSVAIGVSGLVGYRVVENFRWPFLQPDIAAFWRCWHISLTRFTTDYVYRPVMAHWRNHVIAVVASMLAIGFWHEISWRYLVWAAYHAAGLAVHRRFRRWHQGQSRSIPPVISRPLSTLTTFGFVMVGFTFTRTATVAEAADEILAMVKGVW